MSCLNQVVSGARVDTKQIRFVTSGELEYGENITVCGPEVIVVNLAIIGL
jgi:hypothetical protein